MGCVGGGHTCYLSIMADSTVCHLLFKKKNLFSYSLVLLMGSAKCLHGHRIHTLSQYLGYNSGMCGIGSAHGFSLRTFGQNHGNSRVEQNSECGRKT